MTSYEHVQPGDLILIGEPKMHSVVIRTAKVPAFWHGRDGNPLYVSNGMLVYSGEGNHEGEFFATCRDEWNNERLTDAYHPKSENPDLVRVLLESARSKLGSERKVIFRGLGKSLYSDDIEKDITAILETLSGVQN